jgi:hypothetical protein
MPAELDGRRNRPGRRDLFSGTHHGRTEPGPQEASRYCVRSMDQMNDWIIE